MAEQAKRAVEGHRRSCATVPLETCASGLTAGRGASHGRCGAAFSGHLARCSCWFAALRQRHWPKQDCASHPPTVGRWAGVAGSVAEHDSTEKHFTIDITAPNCMPELC